MKILNLAITTLTLGSLLSASAQADIIFTHFGRPTGYALKVNREGDQVSYDFYDGKEKVRTLGNRTSYDAKKVVAYSEAQPGAIQTSKDGRSVYNKRGLIIGLTGAMVAAFIIAQKVMKSNDFSRKGLDGVWASTVFTLGYFIPTGAVGGLAGWFGGGALHDTLFLTIDETASLARIRAILTSKAAMENKEVLSETDDALKAIEALDSGLKEIK